MSKGFIHSGRSAPEKDWQDRLRRRKKAGGPGFLLPGVLAAAASAIALALLLPGWLFPGRAVPSSTPPAVSSAAATASVAASSAAAASPAPDASPSAAANPTDTAAMAEPGKELINTNGKTILDRFSPPAGFRRVAVEPGSFSGYLRNYPLKPHGAKVHYYDGEVKPDQAYLAVADLDLEGSRLQQCADTVLRMHAEYLFALGRNESIRYHFVSGFDFRWDKWRQGYRVDVDGNKVSWVRKAEADSSEASFKAYLQKLFNYASTLSLEHYDTEPVDPRRLSIGDMFLKGGSPGHVVLVADMAEEPETGRKCFILLQGYMPAQDAQILRNLEDEAISPWVMLPEEPAGEFRTPEYLFTWDEARRFKTIDN